MGEGRTQTIYCNENSVYDVVYIVIVLPNAFHISTLHTSFMSYVYILYVVSIVGVASSIYYTSELS